MLALFGDVRDWQSWITSPWAWVIFGFQIWMLVDAVRREEWIWVILIFFFSILTALLYFFLVYRQAPQIAGPRKFEIPGAHRRKRIRELKAQIHHLDKPHHHFELGSLYLEQGKLAEAEKHLQTAVQREPQDEDFQAAYAHSLLRQNKSAEAVARLEPLVAANPRHNYGETAMALAEAYQGLNRPDDALAVWKKVLEHYSYARARVRLAELYLAKGAKQEARAEIDEVLADDAYSSGFQRKLDRPWVRKAKQIRAQLR